MGAGALTLDIVAAVVRGPGGVVTVTSDEAQGVATEAPERVGLDRARLGRADDAVRRLLTYGEFSAITLAVSRHGQLAFERCFGTTRYTGGEPVTGRSLFAIASVSKPIAATAIVLLIEQGLFHLGTPVAELVPDFGRNGKQGVTIEHLLTHTAGLNEQFIDGVPSTTREAYFERLHQAPLMWPPGSHVAYSSVGFSALGEIIEHTTGTAAPQFVADALFAPLGMRDTFFSPPEEHHARIVECTHLSHGGCGGRHGDVLHRDALLGQERRKGCLLGDRCVALRNEVICGARQV